MKRIISFIVILLIITGTQSTSVYSSNAKIDEETIESLIRGSFDLYINLNVSFENIIDKNATPIRDGGDDKKYYPGIGDYANISTLENLKRSLYTEEMADLIYKNDNKYYTKYKKVGDKLYYDEDYRYYNYIRFTYSLPEKLIENINIVYNREGKAYVIFPYIEYSLLYDEIRIKHMGVYLSNTENGVRISDINYVPKFFGSLPVSNSEEITLEEVQILTKNAYMLAYFTKNGSDMSYDTLFDLSGIRSLSKSIEIYGQKLHIPCKGFEYYEDWLNIASSIFTDSKVNPVFELADDSSWVRKGEEVYVHYTVPIYVMLQYPLNNCKIISNGNGKAKAEVTLEYLHDDVNVQILNLIAEFEKTENGWRITGGEYYDYLYIDRSLTNPKTNDGKSIIAIPFVILLLTLFKRKII